jgi:hypothetical protein
MAAVRWADMAARDAPFALSAWRLALAIALHGALGAGMVGGAIVWWGQCSPAPELFVGGGIASCGVALLALCSALFIGSGGRAALGAATKTWAVTTATTALWVVGELMLVGALSCVLAASYSFAALRFFTPRDTASALCPSADTWLEAAMVIFGVAAVASIGAVLVMAAALARAECIACPCCCRCAPRVRRCALCLCRERSDGAAAAGSPQRSVAAKAARRNVCRWRLLSLGGVAAVSIAAAALWWAAANGVPWRQCFCGILPRPALGGTDMPALTIWAEGPPTSSAEGLSAYYAGLVAFVAEHKIDRVIARVMDPAVFQWYDPAAAL